MTGTDLRGNPVGTASPAARDSAERALWRMMSFYDVPLPDLDAAIAADPDWALPHLMKAGFLLSLTEARFVGEARAHLQAGQDRLARRPLPREEAHADALQSLADGRWARACQVWDTLLLEHPRDALALQWAQLWDFHRGDSAQLRLRPARALPDWDADDPLAAYVWALYAFGLEECQLYGRAEEAARKALSLNPRVPWAIHAVAHVMDMQGRFDEGSVWLRQQQAVWAEGNGFSTHLHWHKALFRLEALDITGVWRLVDNQFRGAELQIELQRVDAAALLWRLHLLGHDVSAAFRALLEGWTMDDADAGHSCFNDLHRVLALLGAGEQAQAERWVARCAQRLMDATDATRTQHAVARDTALPLLRGLLALGRGDGDEAARLIYAARATASRCGGSHAQRDVLDQSLLAAAAQGSPGTRDTLGRALINERLLAKPMTPLTQHWVQQLGFAARAAG
jgi:tetratricopeptide (TPR) repeat protein